jgi:5-methylcytosine-specific restriction protein A
MAAYLICWKPASENSERGWPEEKFVALFEQFQRTGKAQEKWRFSKLKNVKVGERAFLIRQGHRGHAVLGYGTISQLPKNRERWTTISFDALLHPRSGQVLANRQELQSISTKWGVWNSMSSGITLKPAVASALERLVVSRKPIPDTLGEIEGGKDWSEEELAAAVRAYLEMRSSLLAGKKVNKSKLYATLSVEFGRTAKAFEFRMQNISHVLSLMGRDWIPGLPPAKNVGRKVAAQIEELIFQIEGQRSRSVVAYELELASLQEGASETDPPPSGQKKPKRRTVQVTDYDRDPRVAAWVLRKAKGKCEGCTSHAPFKKDDGSLFLEVHHVVRLADGGRDMVDNAVALCPNCHRELHHGINRREIVQALLKKVARLKESSDD